jgi:hypothetical protein
MLSGLVMACAGLVFGAISVSTPGPGVSGNLSAREYQPADTIGQYPVNPNVTVADDVVSQGEVAPAANTFPGEVQLQANAEGASPGVAASSSPQVSAIHAVRVIGRSSDPRSYGQRAEAGGTAVAVKADKLHTASHLTARLMPGWTIEVEVDGKWVAATYAGVPGKDLAVLTIPNGSLQGVPVREPIYGERLTVYGLKTKSFSQGTYAGDMNKAIGSGHVPLDVGQAPALEGDSGGGVFGDDGALVGTISGSPVDSPMVVTMVPIVSSPPAAAAAPKRTSSVYVSADLAPSSGNCVNGVCSAPPQQMYQPTFGKQRRGGFGFKK